MTTSSQAHQPEQISPAVAVVGSGPSGCYVAQMLRKQWPDAEITVFDRLPVPFGLLRYGVAPDHQHTKRLTHQFGRVFEDEGTRFAGNVEVGRDMSMDELRASYHVVVLAAGVSGDRDLGIPGSGLAGVYGAGQVMRWINAHPDEADFDPYPGEQAVIVGNGNVAVDVLRMLAKDESHFVGSDVDAKALAGLQRSRPRRIHVVGRSAAEHSKFDTAMIRELAELDHVSFEVEPFTTEAPSEAGITKIQALRDLAKLRRPGSRVTVSFHFGWNPMEVHGTDRVQAMSFVGGEGGRSILTLAADSIMTAIGFVAHKGSALLDYSMTDPAEGSDRGRITEGLYSCGWFRRGAIGAIPANRSCAKEVVGMVIRDIDLERLERKSGFGGLPGQLRAHSIDYSAWQQIDALETRQAAEGRIRRKLGRIEDLLNAAQWEAARELNAVRYPKNSSTTTQQHNNTSEGH